jgi:hypothetical protein
MTKLALSENVDIAVFSPPNLIKMWIKRNINGIKPQSRH